MKSPLEGQYLKLFIILAFFDLSEYFSLKCKTISLWGNGNEGSDKVFRGRKNYSPGATGDCIICQNATLILDLNEEESPTKNGNCYRDFLWTALTLGELKWPLSQSNIIIPKFIQNYVKIYMSVIMIHKISCSETFSPWSMFTVIGCKPQKGLKKNQSLCQWMVPGSTHIRKGMRPLQTILQSQQSVTSL